MLIFRFLSLVCESVAEVVNPPGVQAHEFAPGSTVAPDTILNQLSILLQLSICLGFGSGF